MTCVAVDRERGVVTYAMRTADERTALIAAAEERLSYLARLLGLVLELYEPTPCAADRVRSSEVAADVAAVLRVECSPWFRRDLNQAMRETVRRVNASGVMTWVGLRKQGK